MELACLKKTVEVAFELLIFFFVLKQSWCNSYKDILKGCCFMVLRYGRLWKPKTWLGHFTSLGNHTKEDVSISRRVNILIPWWNLNKNICTERIAFTVFENAANTGPPDPLDPKPSFSMFTNKSLISITAFWPASVTAKCCWWTSLNQP